MRVVGQKRRAYALVAVLGFTLVFTVIALSILNSRSSASSNLAIAKRDLARSILIQNTQASLGLRLSEKTLLRDKVRLDKDFVEDENGQSLRVRWRDRTDSVHRPLQTSYATGSVLFDPDKFLPFTGYQKDALLPACEDIKLAHDHTATQFEFKGTTERYRTVFSGAFPYALSAPQGSVVADSVESFSNHTHREAEQTPGETGVSAWVRAEGLIHVGKFPFGRAVSAVGPVDVSGGAVAFQVPPSPDKIAQQLARETLNAANSIKQDTLDKTEAFVGHALDADGLLNLFKGSGSLWMLASAQQATMVPFFPFPGYRDDKLLKTLILHHPWPPDIRDGHGNDLAEKIKSVRNQRNSALADRKRLRAEDAELYRLILKYPEQKEKIKQWELRRKELRVDISRLQEVIGKLDRELEILVEMQNHERWAINAKGVAPRHDAPYENFGWAYLYLLYEPVEIIGQIFEPGTRWESIVTRITNPTRLFHFGNREPEWYFPDSLPEISDGFRIRRPATVPPNHLSLKSTMNVPAGRTLKLTTNTQIRGDLWLQKGSTLVIEGHLEVRPPLNWNDNKGNKVYQNTPGFPNGRVMLEEGSTLIVDGNLTCLGGIPEYGSILTVGPINRVHPLSSAIIVRGNLTTTHGIHPATSIEELLAYAQRDNPEYRSAHHFFSILGPVFTSLSRVTGPFGTRTPHFASYNTNLNLVQVKKFLVPIPIALPYDNCMLGIFKVFSYISSIQLNLRLGQYFYTQYQLWPLGRGVTPVLIKTTPDDLGRLLDPLRNLPNLGNIDIGPLVKDTVLELGKTVLLSTGKKFLVASLQSITGKNPKCLSWKDAKEPEKIEKFLKEVLKKVGTKAFSAVQ
ncbi:MAG TPA: hypothetical protein EYO33_32465, partial [Phycisphaerales bacterium]|nr:hypothetical protein [Phycisphaerales bacterium]